MPCDDDDDDDDGDGDEYTNTTFSSVCIYSYTVHQITIISHLSDHTPPIGAAVSHFIILFFHSKALSFRGVYAVDPISSKSLPLVLLFIFLVVSIHR